MHYTLPAHIIFLELSYKHLPEVQIMMLLITQFSPHYLHVTGRMEQIFITACSTVGKPSYTASSIPHLSLVSSAKFQLRVSMYSAGWTLTRLQYEVK